MAFAALVMLLMSTPSLSFAPETPAFTAAADDYRAIWTAEGERITAALERVSGLPVPDGPIAVIVYEGRSTSGIVGTPMRLRASYSVPAKRAAIVHELAHRLIARLPRDPAMDEHRTLFLILYDVWTDLWGQAFADDMVALERERRGHYDYDGAWTWALAMTRGDRQAHFAALRNRR